MGRVIYQYKEYAVRMTEKDYKVFLKEDENNHHGHMQKIEHCQDLINMICKEKVPTNTYWRECARRVAKEGKYKDLLERKAERDRDRPPYRNINKGVR